MGFDGPGDWPEEMLDTDSITVVALGILEAPHPTHFDTWPTEDPKANVIFDLGGEDFKADFSLLFAVPVNFRFLAEGERLRWAEDVLQKAKTGTLRALSPYDLMRAYRV